MTSDVVMVDDPFSIGGYALADVKLTEPIPKPCAD